MGKTIQGGITMKRIVILLIVLAMLTACSKQEGGQPEVSTVSSSTQSSSSEEAPSEPSGPDGVEIVLAGEQTHVDGNNIQFSQNTLTISGAGSYVLSGELSGMVLVDAGKEDEIELTLRGAHISNDTSAALYIRKAGRVTVTLAPSSENSLSTTGEFAAFDDNNVDGAIFSKADLTFQGAGTLTVSCASGHGVVSKDNLVVQSGSYAVTATGHGLSAKDSVTLAGGTAEIVSGKDGIKAENKDDAALGNLQITGGTWNITASGDGISAANSLQIDDGTFQIQAGGGSNAVLAEDASAKGVKAGGQLLLNGGAFVLDAADDALHTNGSLTLTGGSYQIATGDDGLHADGALEISGGSLEISQSYEGIEGQTVAISGGEIRLRASDDGLNAAGGTDQSGFGGPFGRDSFAGNADCGITISGGKIFVNADGDGIDSNGYLLISGGEIYVCGPTSGADGALDYDGSGQITGGIVIAAGAMGMAQNFDSTSTQCAALVQTGHQQAGTISITDADGNVLVTMEAEKEYECVVFSCPQMKVGESCTVNAGGQTFTVEQSETITGSMGGGMGRPNGWGGPNGEGMGTPPEKPNGEGFGQMPPEPPIE